MICNVWQFHCVHREMWNCCELLDGFSSNLHALHTAHGTRHHRLGNALCLVLNWYLAFIFSSFIFICTRLWFSMKWLHISITKKRVKIGILLSAIWFVPFIATLQFNKCSELCKLLYKFRAFKWQDSSEHKASYCAQLIESII